MGHKLTFRDAERKDTALILQFIKELANYEKMLDEVVADEATLEMWIFDKQKTEVIFALEDGKEIGFALFFITFPRFSDGPVFIWKICMSGPNAAARNMAKLF